MTVGELQRDGTRTSIRTRMIKAINYMAIETHRHGFALATALLKVAAVSITEKDDRMGNEP